MPSSCESGVAMMLVCQTCGDKGDARLLIYCMKCQDSAVHHYCLDKVSPDDDQISWMCEECAPKVAKAESYRKSERITLRKDRAVEIQINWMRRINKNSSSTSKKLVNVKEELAETSQLTGDCSPTGEETKNQHSFDATCGNQELRLMLEDGGSSQEQFESVAVKAPPFSSDAHHIPLNILYNQPSLKSDEVFAKPLIEPIWRGSFSITDEKHAYLVGIMAHLSSKACLKVSDAATALPPVLNVEILSSCDAWPKFFRRSPPMDNSIGLYFFPKYERDEKFFDGLLDDIIEQDLALKAIIGDVELLIFSSLKLPQQHWRFQRKYYLWGVFRQKKYQSLALVPVDHPAD